MMRFLITLFIIMGLGLSLACGPRTPQVSSSCGCLSDGSPALIPTQTASLQNSDAGQNSSSPISSSEPTQNNALIALCPPCAVVAAHGARIALQAIWVAGRRFVLAAAAIAASNVSDFGNQKEKLSNAPSKRATISTCHPYQLQHEKKRSDDACANVNAIRQWTNKTSCASLFRASEALNACANAMGRFLKICFPTRGRGPLGGGDKAAQSQWCQLKAEASELASASLDLGCPPHQRTSFRSIGLKSTCRE